MILCSKCNNEIKRSTAQNSYWWVCMTILSKEIGYTPEQLNYLIKKLHGWGEEFINKKTGELIFLPDSSADWNKKLFSERTETLLQFASEHNVVIQTPEDYFNQT